MNRDTKAKVGL